jgi:hypothetical protein
MQVDDLFPLDDVPPRVRKALLAEFAGRRPSIREVHAISDQRWLATPEIGERSLTIIRRITGADRAPTDIPSSSMTTDTELLRCLDAIQRELEALLRLLKVRFRKESRGKAILRQLPAERMETIGNPHRPW